MLILRNATLPTSRWSNGAGRKADLASGDGWMVGFAWLDGDAPFSHWPGMARTITLVAGPGFTLEISGAPLVVHTMFAPAQFDGGAPTHCRVAGPSRVLNAMTERSRFSHDVTIATRTMTIEPGAATACLVVLLSGTGMVCEAGASVELGMLDAARLDAPVEVRLGADSHLAIVTINRNA